MANVLREGGWAEIGFAIIKTVVIDVIDQHIIGDLAYLAMHEVHVSFARRANPTSRVVRRAALGRKPFISAKPQEIIRIDDGELALGQRYPAERIAVSNAPIQKRRPDDDPNKPERDGYRELNLAAPLQLRVN